ncbi:hypothetical protein PV682_27610 [Streptomyces niveiscabiei]|uniref:hypothetical protein n=1 Tax=Streptomyces niveiscabiei TaxID=164115 RepID=UPI0029ABCD07|nr:hypothetical protein [Streptomyces niveiscabiei]MDX3385214.1 hypothetical protein [Streptomyces niveiscabiei]
MGSSFRVGWSVAAAGAQFEPVAVEAAVVGDGDDGAPVGTQVVLQPAHGRRVEVVRGFVEEEPFSPTTAAFSPGRTVKVTWSRTVRVA